MPRLGGMNQPIPRLHVWFWKQKRGLAGSRGVRKTVKQVNGVTAHCGHTVYIMGIAAFAAQGGAGLRWRPQSVKRFEAPTEPAGETSPLFAAQ